MDEYETQAQKFLTDTGATLTVELSKDQTNPHWDKDTKQTNHYKYDVTLARGGSAYKFNFWESINQAEKMDALNLLKESSWRYDTPQQLKALDLLKREGFKNISNPALIRKHYDELTKQLAPSAYSILAALSLVYEDDFEDWCASFGYDTDSKTADETYKLCLEEDRQLRRLFTTEELTQLEEIA